MARHERIIGTRIELCGVMKVQKCIEQNASEHGGSLKCVAADSNTPGSPSHFPTHNYFTPDSPLLSP
jgi:hypothetical protein